jgi:WD40 repeat protein
MGHEIKLLRKWLIVSASGSSDMSIRIWKANGESTTLECIKTLLGHTDTVDQLVYYYSDSFNPDVDFKRLVHMEHRHLRP